jgi:lipopolysaccharide transport system permease protein
LSRLSAADVYPLSATPGGAVLWLLAPFRTLLLHRRVIGSFVRRDLRTRYVNSVLGLSWAIIQPMSLLVLYTFVFSIVLGVRFGTDTSTSGFALYLFCGMLPWLAFSEGIGRSASVILDHATLIKKVVFPSEVLPAYVVASALATELIGLGVLLVATAVFYRLPGWSLLFLPLLIAAQALFTLGLGWILASLTVFLRDVSQFLGLGLTLWMLITPIFYPPELMPARFQFVIAANPMAYLIQGYRNVILDRRPPEPWHLLVLVAIGLGAFLAGYWFFRRSKNAFVDVL